MPRELDAALDLLIDRWGKGAHEPEVVRARDAYAERTGRVFQEDELYEARTTAFLEWYVLEWPFAGGAPAVVRSIRDPLPEDDEERRSAFRAWASSHRSLFLVFALDEGTVRLHDLVGGGDFAVDERRRIHGVARADIIEARLVGWRDRVRFGRTFGFHPAGARAAIEAHARRIRAEGGTRADVVDHVAALRVKVERWRHVAPERVYEVAGKVPGA
jgi:hypothetical protein